MPRLQQTRQQPHKQASVPFYLNSGQTRRLFIASSNVHLASVFRIRQKI